MAGTATQRPIAFSLALGLLGGAALIVTAWNTHRGPLALIPYAVLVIVAWLYLRAEKVQGFVRRFGLTLGAFMFATLLFDLFIGTVVTGNLLRIPWWGHAWRLGFMLLVGGALSAAVAQLTATSQRASPSS